MKMKILFIQKAKNYNQNFLFIHLYKYPLFDILIVSFPHRSLHRTASHRNGHTDL